MLAKASLKGVLYVWYLIVCDYVDRTVIGKN